MDADSFRIHGSDVFIVQAVFLQLLHAYNRLTIFLWFLGGEPLRVVPPNYDSIVATRNDLSRKYFVVRVEGIDSAVMSFHSVRNLPLLSVPNDQLAFEWTSEESTAEPALAEGSLWTVRTPASSDLLGQAATFEVIEDYFFNISPHNLSLVRVHAQTKDSMFRTLATGNWPYALIWC
jgi:hypothetical protein